MRSLGRGTPIRVVAVGEFVTEDASEINVSAAWTRADDPEGAGGLARAAARTAARLRPDGPAALPARLLAIVAVDSRGYAAADASLPRAALPPPPNPGAHGLPSHAHFPICAACQRCFAG